MRHLIGYALALLLGLFLAVTSARVESRVAQVLETLSRPAQTVSLEVTTVTLTKTLPNGTTLSLTWTQRQGESDADFMARVRAEWDAYCKEFGG